jgi:hypothetical protein
MTAGLLNGAAPRPPLGWQNWNGFGMNFNASLIRRTASAMSQNGLLGAGFSLLSLGGSTYPHQGIPPWNSSDPTKRQYLIVRNSTGYYQIDPARFPGPGSTADCLNETILSVCLKSGKEPDECGCFNGNEGMRLVTQEVRAKGYSWGSYSNMAGCQVEECNRSDLNASYYDDFVTQDWSLFVGDWGSSYVMVDVVGMVTPKGFDRISWSRAVMNKWSTKAQATSEAGAVILHDCHNGCASTYAGPTVVAAPCNASDPAQHWMVPIPPRINSTNKFANGTAFLVNGDSGMCVGCSDSTIAGECANTAERLGNGSGLGLGMQACQQSVNWISSQNFNYTDTDQIVRRGKDQVSGLQVQSMYKVFLIHTLLDLL